MIVDFNSAGEFPQFKSKICIVGAGVMGLTIASEFLCHRDSEIIIVESGGLQTKAENDPLDEVINIGDAQSAVQGSRTRVFGGTSTLWGGQALPFIPIDFSAKDWVKNSGWPLEYSQLEPYYKRAAKVLNLDDANFSADNWLKNKPQHREVTLNTKALDLYYSKWSPQPDLSKQYKQIIEKTDHITTLINATVVDIVPQSDLKVIKELKLKSLTGKQGTIRADIFILCSGGIENPRLLLASNSVKENGIGNHSGNVGKFYQDHIGIYGARLVPKNFDAFHQFFSNILIGKQTYLPKLGLSEKFQFGEKLLNVNGNISIQSGNDSVINQLKRFRETLRAHGMSKHTVNSLIKVTKTPSELFRIIDSYYFKNRKYFSRDATFFMIANCECEPIKQSSIKLSDQLDVLGLPKAEVNWNLTELSRKSLIAYYKELKKELEFHGIAETIIKPELLESGSENWKSRCYSLYHHMGATRMSNNAKEGVVDSNCKVHEIDNLFIAGSSVFPTTSASNPTFTAMALAIRLADHLKKTN